MQDFFNWVEVWRQNVTMQKILPKSAKWFGDSSLHENEMACFLVHISHTVERR